MNKKKKKKTTPKELVLKAFLIDKMSILFSVLIKDDTNKFSFITNLTNENGDVLCRYLHRCVFQLVYLTAFLQGQNQTKLNASVALSA